MRSLSIFEARIMDYTRSKSPNIGNVLNARRLARRKLQRSARRDREKLEPPKKVNINAQKNQLIVNCVYTIRPPSERMH